MKKQFQHEEKNDKGRFYVTRDENEIGEINYDLSHGSTLTINSTEVDEDARGEGLGSDLVEMVIDYARANDFTVESKCSFATKVIESSKRLKTAVEESKS